ncbi:DUF3099 domain-containing protein [Arthrobacter sulfonylureivorans]|uniref:DUF3099 domain-containing protein n=1 Tax=Arthrobacter sulfonylureivorans TaxID=2486855 RepID=UPI0039E2FFD7
MSKQPDEKPEVLSITDVPESHTDEMHRRMVKYTLAMGIRLACLLLFFFIDAWFRWFFVAGAVFLPWIAVIIANGGSDKSHLTHSTALLDQAPLPELEAPTASDDSGKNEDGDFLTGVVIDDMGQHPAPAQSSASTVPGQRASTDPVADEPQASAGAAGPAPSTTEQEHYDQSAAFMGSLSPVVKRRRRKTAA